MKIEIKESELPIKLQRKLKLLAIEGKYQKVGVNYDWKVFPENSKESIKDLHLFCLQTTRNLLLNMFKTNENGIISYNIETPDITKIDELIEIIEEEKKLK